ncbi:MAG: acVLRF1 family peptidyl-tRNA hydrolase, partial [Sporichthyaceae bacterium]
MSARVVDVEAGRLVGWLQRFEARHGPTTWQAGPDLVVVSAADGSRAECEVPFPPLVLDNDAAYGGLPDHVRKERCVGVLLVRLGGHAAGVFSGSELMSSKVGSRLVHGRSSAGGWSQQRFARR